MMFASRRFRGTMAGMLGAVLTVWGTIAGGNAAGAGAVGVEGSPVDWTLHTVPPARYAGDMGRYRSVLRFDDGRPVTQASEWPARREEIRTAWMKEMGPWPPRVEHPRWEVIGETRREGYREQKVRVEWRPGGMTDAYMLLPDAGEARLPAVLVLFYDPETSVGLKAERPGRDFARQLTHRGFATLSLGTPGGNAWKPDLAGAACQPLSYHAYLAANAWQALADHPRVDAARIGVTGHSYGGKWALFAGAFWDRFAAVAVSDPGVAFDESRPNVNYWEPWYLGWDPAVTRAAGVPSAERPRTGAYARLVRDGRDLHEVHALLAPRPFLVSGGSEDPPERWQVLNPLVAVNTLLGQKGRVAMTHRPAHDPTEESNRQMVAFFAEVLGLGGRGR